VYAEAIILLEQGIPETQVPSTMPQGKAIDVRDRQLVVRLKDYFDQERHQGLSRPKIRRDVLPRRSALASVP
jgi:hypothetical protein